MLARLRSSLESGSELSWLLLLVQISRTIVAPRLVDRPRQSPSSQFTDYRCEITVPRSAVPWLLASRSAFDGLQVD